MNQQVNREVFVDKFAESWRGSGALLAPRYGLFSVTSNIDGHWDRTEGVGPAKVYECHGATRNAQALHIVGLFSAGIPSLKRLEFRQAYWIKHGKPYCPTPVVALIKQTLVNA